MFRAAACSYNIFFQIVAEKYYSERMEELLKKEQELLRMNAEIDEKNRKLRKDDRKKRMIFHLLVLDYSSYNIAFLTITRSFFSEDPGKRKSTLKSKVPRPRGSR